MDNHINKFYKIQNCSRIWAIGSIHGNYKSLKKVHNHIINQFTEQDTLIYLGNVIGVGEQSTEVLNEIVQFRLILMAKFKTDPDKIIFLRGAQEEMFIKLLELQLSPNPKDILIWMFSHGVDKTLLSYGFKSNDILDICSLGTVVVSKWTTKLKNQISLYPGHKEYYSHLIHAAFSNTRKILFVNRGVDVSRPLSAQNDCFWWGYHGLSNITNFYNSFKKIVRGYDPKKIGPSPDKIVCSLYKGSGFGAYIVGGLFSDSGNILDLFEA